MENNNKYIGQTFGGRYRIVSVVGVGGMSVVYGAYDISSGETYALKMLDMSSCKSEAAREEAERRFFAETHIMSMLSHPNIVNIKGISGAGEPPYFVMEYVEANTLKHRIESCGALTPDETIHYAKQILNALKHAHSRGVAHCDVKPQNIMLLSDGSIKLTDFGIARVIDSKENSDSDKAVGTVYYISPEQASGKRIDGRSDIYSLGVMMYEMATGRLPFSAEDTSTVSRMHIEEAPMRPRVLDPEIPKGLEQIILHAMEKPAFTRFADAEEMLEAVLEVENDPETEFDFNKEPKESAPETKSGGTKWGALALLGSAAIFIIVLLILLTVILSGGKSYCADKCVSVKNNIISESVWNSKGS